MIFWILNFEFCSLNFPQNRVTFCTLYPQWYTVTYNPRSHCQWLAGFKGLMMSQKNCNFAPLGKSNAFPVDTGRKLNVHKTFRRRPERLLNVLCTFNLRPVSTGFTFHESRKNSNLFFFVYFLRK